MVSMSINHNRSLTIVEFTDHSGWPFYLIGYIKATKRWFRNKAVEFNEMCFMFYRHFFERC